MINIARKKIIVSAISILIIGAGILIFGRFYPVAFAEWKPIIYSDLLRDYSAAVVYYGKAAETYDKNNADVINSSEVRNEIKRAALESSIEDILISNELEKLFSGSELKSQINKNIETAIAGKDIEKETETLYGLSKSDFTKSFLEPQARREILEARMRLENGNFYEWLKDTKKNAKITIFLPGFEWKDGAVVVKK